MGAGDQEIVNDTINGHAWKVTATDPDIDLGWESVTFDASIQVSKKLLFFRPYLGAGYTFGKSTVTGGVASDLSFERDAGSSDYETLAADIEAEGGTAPELSNSGFSYSTTYTDPVFRIYGGFSLEVLIILDAQVMYVPASKALAASLTTRLQL